MILGYSDEVTQTFYGAGEKIFPFWIAPISLNYLLLERLDLRRILSQGSWVAQLVKHLASAHGFKPFVGLCADSSEPGACLRLSPNLPAPPPLAHAHSVSLKNK